MFPRVPRNPDLSQICILCCQMIARDRVRPVLCTEGDRLRFSFPNIVLRVFCSESFQTMTGDPPSKQLKTFGVNTQCRMASTKAWVTCGAENRRHGLPLSCPACFALLLHKLRFLPLSPRPPTRDTAARIFTQPQTQLLND